MAGRDGNVAMGMYVYQPGLPPFRHAVRGLPRDGARKPRGQIFAEREREVKRTIH